MVKVLSIVPYNIFPAKAGGQKGIAFFNAYFAKEVELTCLTVKSNLPHFANGYRLLNILPDKPYRYANPLNYYIVKKYIDKYRITHLLLEHPYLGWLGILLKKFTGVKLIVHSHNIEATRWKSLGKWWWWILLKYEYVTHRYADYNFFIHDDDRHFAINNFRLDGTKCTTITYGIEINKPPEPEERDRCRALLQQTHGIAATEKIFLFNGALDYRPNYLAVQVILNKINPILLESGFIYKIIICGKGLQGNMHSLKEYAERNILYTGFVEDISIYFKGADVFLNPVTDGGGIKTKLVEALGYNTKTVSTQNGSIGVNAEVTNGQLIIVPDNDWLKFSAQMIQAANQTQQPMPAEFYKTFYWENIAKKAAEFIVSGQ